MDKQEAIFSVEVCDAWCMPIFRFEIAQDRAGHFSRYVEKEQVFNLHLDKDLEKATKVYVSDSQMQAFEKAMKEFAIEDRYTHYPNCGIRYMTLDGTSWVMSYSGRRIQGSNFGPEGLHELAVDLQKIFGVDDLPKYLNYPEGFDVKVCPDSRIFLDYEIYTYDPDDYYEDEVEDMEERLEERNSRIEAASKEMLHDVRLYSEKHSEVKDYATVLQKNGIELDMGKMKAADVDCLNTECIMALLVAVSRMDHLEDSSYFSECFKDGTFRAWLERLNDATREEWRCKEPCLRATMQASLDSR